MGLVLGTVVVGSIAAYMMNVREAGLRESLVPVTVTVTATSPVSTYITVTATSTTTATLTGTAAGAGSTSYVLGLKFDKTSLQLGEDIIVTVEIIDPRCYNHGHRVDIYIYHESGFLEQEYVLDRAPNTVTHKPQRKGIYTVKLWVIHIGLSRYSFLDGQATFTVL